MDKSKDPRIKCTGVALTKAAFGIKPGATSRDLEGEYDLMFEFGHSVDQNGLKLNSFLEVKCKNQKKPEIVDIIVRVDGNFEGEDKEFLDIFAPNSGAVLLPYVRTYLATLTGWGPMNPLILPILNMTKAGLARSDTQGKRRISTNSES